MDALGGEVDRLSAKMGRMASKLDRITLKTDFLAGEVSKNSQRIRVLSQRLMKFEGKVGF